MVLDNEGKTISKMKAKINFINKYPKILEPEVDIDNDDLFLEAAVLLQGNQGLFYVGN